MIAPERQDKPDEEEVGHWLAKAETFLATVRETLDDLRATSPVPERGEPAPVVSAPLPDPHADVMAELARVRAESDAMRAKLLADECKDWTRVSVVAKVVGASDQCVRNHCLAQEAIENELLRDFPVRRVGPKKKWIELGLSKYQLFYASHKEAEVARKSRDLQKWRQQRAARGKYPQ